MAILTPGYKEVEFRRYFDSSGRRDLPDMRQSSTYDVYRTYRTDGGFRVDFMGRPDYTYMEKLRSPFSSSSYTVSLASGQYLYIHFRSGYGGDTNNYPNDTILRANESSMLMVKGWVDNAPSRDYFNPAIDYGDISHIRVVASVPPTIPSSISVPSSYVAGNQLNISWGESTPTDATISNYELEVKYNGGSYSQIYKGSNRSFSYSIPKNNYTSAQFRVRAIDSNHEYSEYKESSLMTIINNRSPSNPGTVNVTISTPR